MIFPISTRTIRKLPQGLSITARSGNSMQSMARRYGKHRGWFAGMVEMPFRGIFKK